ncbi:unnamed protein product [Rotaria socialis]|uniref:Uncharacterized protein n=1 Tax=Rotaria socialis TaxID=392032 RepID=A0A818NXU4_9BILA|nr:unnamed protein product [Rotaria socialis]CAF3305855.1 unnamed protein product [Rotaria socialis]CAF3329025.1 unnamed protein product [Rotaria socialis]CAF3611999.1 unnamed protein product [Rotaria socialis]CAF3717986.1 unnamed protein product [Rotaria socialis]
MAFSNLFRRHSTTADIQAASYAYMDGNSTAETLLEELENQCRNSVTIGMSQNKRGSDIFTRSTDGSPVASYDDSPLNVVTPSKRHASVDYTWLTPNKNLSQSINDSYHLSDIIKMELSELILNVLAEDCTLIINQFRRQIHDQTKPTTPENIIALFRKTICDYVDQKPKSRASVANINDTINSNMKVNAKGSTGIYSIVRNNRINPKRQFDDERNCIAELTEISITSSNDGTENNHPHSFNSP